MSLWPILSSTRFMCHNRTALTCRQMELAVCVPVTSKEKLVRELTKPDQAQVAPVELQHKEVASVTRGCVLHGVPVLKALAERTAAPACMHGLGSHMLSTPELGLMESLAMSSCTMVGCSSTLKLTSVSMVQPEDGSASVRMNSKTVLEGSGEL